MDEDRTQSDIGGVAIYAIPRHQDAVGKAHPFEFFHDGVQYLADITFDFDHYAETLYGDAPHPLQRTECYPEKPCPVEGLLDAVMENLPLPAALKYPDGSIAWCNLEYLSLVRRISPRWRRFYDRKQLYGETSVRLFDLESEQAQAITNIETRVVDQSRPLIAYDYIHRERRLTLRSPVLDQRKTVRFFGVLSMPD